jgi:uncharacterized SAM-dependent methyltransferase
LGAGKRDLIMDGGLNTSANNGGATRGNPSSGKIIPMQKIPPFHKAWLELYEGRKAGHMGAFEYANGGMKLWDGFLFKNGTHDRYYIPLEEQALIERCAHMSANLLEAAKTLKVTLVSRGPGTKFSAKEGALVRAFGVAGIEIAKVVYIDVSKPALNQSMKEGKALLPDAEHQAIVGDIFDPETKNQYKILGTEVGTCFGGTPMNAYGRHDMAPPLSAVEGNLSGIRGQMRKGSHFIAVYDHNQDKKTIEAAYAGQEEFAKHMLEIEQHLGMNTDDIDFVVEFNPDSKILAHGFYFQKETPFVAAGRHRVIEAGTTLYFNNSVKLTETDTASCYEHSSFGYVDLEEGNPIMAGNGRMGYHHAIAS